MHDNDEHQEPRDVHVLPGFPSSAAPANDYLDEEGAASALRLSAARRILESRRMRTQMLDPAMFGEPAWDMLLTLYVHEAVGRRLTKANLAQSVEVSPSVAVRWQDYLERQGLTELVHGEAHGPLHLQLSRKGRDALNCYLTQVSGA